MKSKINRKYGWKPQLPDHRDFEFEIDKKKVLKSVTLFDKYHTPPVYDQGQIGSCVDNATAGVTEYNLMNGFKLDKPNPLLPLFMPSRLFLYYYARSFEGTTDSDSGSSVRDGVKALAQKGVCSEQTWPYSSDITVEPNEAAQLKALSFETTGYYAIANSNRLNGISQALQLGHPVIFGFTVYESFESETVAETGVVPIPSKHEQVLGGHCVAIWGINVEEKYVLCRNSWGKDWGINGYFKMPFDYITSQNLSSDYWVIKETK